MAWKLYCNVEVTRRQSLCHVEDGEGELCFSSKYVLNCIAWLLANDHNEFEMVGDDETLHFLVLAHQA